MSWLRDAPVTVDIVPYLFYHAGSPSRRLTGREGTMNFHWDTPGYRVRTEVAAMLRAMEATGIALTFGNYDRGQEMSAAGVVDPRRRAAAGAWSSTGPDPIEEPSTVWGPHGPMTIKTVQTPTIDEDEIPW